MTFSEIYNYLSSRFILENSLYNILIFSLIVILGFSLKHFLSIKITKVFYTFLRRFTYNVDVEQFLGLIKKPLENIFALWICYFAFSFLDFPTFWHLKPASKFGLLMFLERGYEVLVFVNATWLVLRFIDFCGIVFNKREIERNSKLHEQLIPFLREFVKILVLIFACFLFLGIVFDMNVASIITGLGIGGLAVALAAKESLENLLASFTIFLDKPFVVGDLVKIGNITGIVEKVGFRSTRIRTLEKSLVTMPNKKMVDEILDNLTLRNLRRVKYQMNIAIDSKPEHIEKLVSEIRESLLKHSEVGADASIFFHGFNDMNYSIQILYFVETNDEKVFNYTKEKISLEILKLAELNQIKQEMYIR